MTKKNVTDPFEMLGCIVEDICLKLPAMMIGYDEMLFGCNHIILERTELLQGGGVDRNLSVDEQRVQYVGPGPKISGSKPERASVPLGSLVRHKSHGFEGIVTGRITWINHKPSLDVEPTARGMQGEILSTERFDEDMLEVLKLGEPVFSETYKERMGMKPKPSAEEKKRGSGCARTVVERQPHSPI